MLKGLNLANPTPYYPLILGGCHLYHLSLSKQSNSYYKWDNAEL